MYGIKPGTSRTGHEKDTCTACAGTMILEFAALSRLTGDPIYEVCKREVLVMIYIRNITYLIDDYRYNDMMFFLNTITDNNM